MIINNKIVKTTITMLLALVVLFPVFVKVTHHHTTQNTYTYKEHNNIHFDQTNIDFCDICFFSLTFFNHSISQKDTFNVLFFNTTSIKKKYSFIFSSFVFTNKQLRAPPSLLS